MSVPGAHLESECRPRLLSPASPSGSALSRPGDVQWSSQVTPTLLGLTTRLRSGRLRVTPSASAPALFRDDNKAMLALCREHRLEHRTKHIALRYFLARELQQRGQLRLAYVASEANTADIFTKALAPGDHQRFCTLLACLLCLTGLVFLLVPNSFASSFIPVSSQAARGAARELREGDAQAARGGERASRGAASGLQGAAQRAASGGERAAKGRRAGLGAASGPQGAASGLQGAA
ncbi:unnamed protein product [Closterium sp. NIES-53]